MNQQNNPQLSRRQFLTAASAGAAAAMIPQTATPADKLNEMPNYRTTGARLITNSTPAADGYRYPAEWKNHERCIMVLPPPQNWRGTGVSIADMRAQWADVANTLSQFESVLMVVHPNDRKEARRLFSSEIEILELPVNDGWSRDSGPMFVVNKHGERRVAGFTFNGWGGKFPPFQDDALLKAKLCAHLKTQMYPIGLVLEGGAVTIDGEGTLITTEQCLLNKNRNAGRSKSDVESMLNASLGTSKVIWLGKGLEPDPVTDGHVDGIACFAAPGVVLLHTTNNRKDRNYPICRDAKRRLSEARDAKDRKLEVIEIPLTSYDVAHMNFYIGNDCVLVPTSGRRREDNRPLAILKEAFPEREVVGVDSTVLAAGGGGIHCITQQIPNLTS